MNRFGRTKLLMILMSFVVAAFALSACSDNKTESPVVTQPGPGPNPPPPAISLKGSIKGLVVDVHNSPVAGAQVYLSYPGGSTQVPTDAGGQYILTNVPVAGELQPSTGNTAPGQPYLITVMATEQGFTTGYTAALLDYATLQHKGAIEVLSNPPYVQVVGDLMVEAVATVLGKPTAQVDGKVIDIETSNPLQNVLVSLTGVPIPSADKIWNGGDHWTSCGDWGVGASTWAFPNNTAVTGADGKFLITTVPERTDACPFEYAVTYSLSGFDPLASSASVEVGYGGGTLYHVDPNPLTMRVHLPTPDKCAPYVWSTDIPVGGQIAFGGRDTSFTITFNEVMNTSTGNVYLDARAFKLPAPIALTYTWDAAGQVLTIDPGVTLPEGMYFTLELVNFKDKAGNAYQGQIPNEDCITWKGPDLLTLYNPGWIITYPPLHGGIMAGFMTQGDPTLLQATNFRQTPASVNPAQPIGGKSGNVPQINNINYLDDATGVLGLDVTGDAAGEADTYRFDWTAPAGSPRQYNLYCEYKTGGFVTGLPVLVAQTAKSGAPDTSIAVTLGAIDAAQNAAGVPRLTDPNGNVVNGGNPTLTTALYVNNGFTMNFAVTVVNSDAVEGPYSNVVAAGDNVPPTVADQGEGFDASGLTMWLTPLNGTAETGLPIYEITSAYGGPPTPTVDLEALDLIGGTPGDSIYNAADYAAFTAAGFPITLSLSEDLDGGQDLTGIGALHTSSGAAIANISIPGVGDGLKDVALAITGLPLIRQGDTLDLVGIEDEAGNAAESDAAVIFADSMEPLIVTGVVNDAGTGSVADQIILTFSEPLDETSAENIANYTLAALLGTDTAVLSPSNVVTITASADEQYEAIYAGYDAPAGGLDITPTNVINAAVDDLYGNTGGTLSFAIADQYKPRILGAQTTAGLINDAACAVPANDGIWCVGDTDAVVENYTIIVTMSEPVVWDVNADGFLKADDATALGISASVTPTSTYFSIVGVNDPPLYNVLSFDFQLRAGETVAEGDTFRIVTANDTSGNPINTLYDEIELDAATSGYDIK